MFTLQLATSVFDLMSDGSSDWERAELMRSPDTFGECAAVCTYFCRHPPSLFHLKALVFADPNSTGAPAPLTNKRGCLGCLFTERFASWLCQGRKENSFFAWLCRKKKKKNTTCHLRCQMAISAVLQSPNSNKCQVSRTSQSNHPSGPEAETKGPWRSCTHILQLSVTSCSTFTICLACPSLSHQQQHNLNIYSRKRQGADRGIVVSE